MRVRAGPPSPERAGTEAVAVGVWSDGAPVHGLRPRAEGVQATREDGVWWIAVGLGPRAAWGAERARDAAAWAWGRADEVEARELAWVPPTPDTAAALVEGTLLRGWRGRGPAELVVCGADPAVLERARIGAEAQNRARGLADAPPNEMTPAALAARARELRGVRVEVLDPADEGCGAFAAVARGAEEAPALIAASYDGGGDGPLTAWVGKGVTFDSGGYSLKQAARMAEQKWDMAGAAAVLEAVGALPALGAPGRVLAVIGAAENLVSGRALRPGDVVSARDGTRVEVTNTDAEGRLVLADCLDWARAHGAERLVDLATLTGGVVTALGSSYAGLFGNDGAWTAAVRAAGERAGEPAWPMPIHEDYRRALRGTVSDLVNSPAQRTKAHAPTAAAFLERFAHGLPWAHLDIAGVAHSTGRPATPRGATGWGVRTLLALAAAEGR